MRKTFEMNIAVRVAVTFFVVASLIISVRTLVKYNDFREKINRLEVKKEEYSENIERLKYELSCDIDDEYVIKIAKEKLNLCMPDEVVYYNGLN